MYVYIYIYITQYNVIHITHCFITHLYNMLDIKHMYLMRRARSPDRAPTICPQYVAISNTRACKMLRTCTSSLK